MIELLYSCTLLQVRHLSAHNCFLGVPMVLALMVAVSRTCDNRHHWQDVLIGSLLGVLFAVLGYHKYFWFIAGRRSGYLRASEDAREVDASYGHVNPAHTPDNGRSTPSTEGTTLRHQQNKDQLSIPME
jgi:hypothetical protein